MSHFPKSVEPPFAWRGGGLFVRLAAVSCNQYDYTYYKDKDIQT